MIEWIRSDLEWSYARPVADSIKAAAASQQSVSMSKILFSHRHSQSVEQMFVCPPMPQASPPQRQTSALQFINKLLIVESEMRGFSECYHGNKVIFKCEIEMWMKIRQIEPNVE